MNKELKIIECPRDAMQGRHFPIPTELKRRFINQLLTVGYDTIDFGSFVSPNAVPQMADTVQVLAGLDLLDTKSKLLAIVANYRGAKEAVSHEEIHYLGYPFSISDTFQFKNTNKRVDESWELVQEIHNLCVKANKELVVYISMGFGNPYGDPYSPEIVEQWVYEMEAIGIKTISLADTLGSAEPELITELFTTLVPRYEHVEFGAHFHSNPAYSEVKLEAAFEAGCRRFDVAIMGYGGCPFADDKLVGNISTESLVNFLEDRKIPYDLDVDAIKRSILIAEEVYQRD